MTPVLLLLVACKADPLPLSGTEHLDGPGVVGELRVEPGGLLSDDRLLVSLYGPGMATGGPVEAQVGQVEGDLVWIHFPLGTALGEAEAAMRLQGRQALLPLGARPGEHELRLSRQPGPAQGDALLQARTQAQAALDEARQAWALGSFRLEDPTLRAAGQDALVGELYFRGDMPPVVAVYDLMWWTGAPVQADRVDEGPDIVLGFPVEPALQGEEAQLRVNVPLGLAVVPADRLPTELDRQLELVPGAVSTEQRTAAMDRARAAADRAERDALAELGARIARASRRDDACLPWQQAIPAAADLLVGYEAEVVQDGDDCVLVVDPVVPQHRRRLSLRVGASGILPAHD